MRALLNFISRGRTQAIIAATLAVALAPMLALVLMILPPLVIFAFMLYYVSAGIVTYATFRQGPSEGLKVMAGPALFLALPVILAPDIEGLSPVFFALPLLGIVLGMMVPAVMSAGAIRVFKSAGIGVSVAALAVAFGVLVLTLLDVSPQQLVLQQFRVLLEQVAERHNEAGDVAQRFDEIWGEQARQRTDVQAAVFGGLQAAFSLISIMAVVFLARWWHAIMDNPGGFGQEFRSLRLDRRIVVLSGVLALVSMLKLGAVSSLAIGWLLITGAMFLLQGLAVVHAIVVKRRLGRGLLTALYLLLVFPVVNLFTALVVASVGVMDGWLDFRRRFDAAGA